MTRRSLLTLLAASASADVAAKQLEGLDRLATIAIQADLEHVQGIDVRGNRLWISSVEREKRRGLVHRIELPTGKPAARVEVHDGDRYHPGGMSLDGDSIWVPVAEYKPHSSAEVQRRDAESLQWQESFTVDDHIGCVAVAADRVIGGNWDSEIFYEWDRRGREIARKPRRTATRYQDLKMDGELLAATGNLEGPHGAIDWLSPQTMKLQRRILAGETDRGVRFTNEGMALDEDKLYLLPEDGPSRLFVFRLPWR